MTDKSAAGGYVLTRKSRAGNSCGASGLEIGNPSVDCQRAGPLSKSTAGQSILSDRLFREIQRLCPCLPIRRRPLRSYKERQNWFPIGATIDGESSRPPLSCLWLRTRAPKRR